MRHSRLPLLLMLLAALVLPLLAPVSARADGKDNRNRRATEYGEGNPYCPRRPITVGRVVVPAGRCYTLAVVRNERGAFLAFLAPSVRLHRGEAERLGSLEGRVAWNQILFLVPMPRERIAMIPMNTIQLIRLREEDDEDEDGPRPARSALVVMVPAPAVPSVSATIVITF